MRNSQLLKLSVFLASDPSTNALLCLQPRTIYLNSGSEAFNDVDENELYRDRVKIASTQIIRAQIKKKRKRIEMLPMRSKRLASLGFEANSGNL